MTQRPKEQQVWTRNCEKICGQIVDLLFAENMFGCTLRRRKRVITDVRAAGTGDYK